MLIFVGGFRAELPGLGFGFRAKGLGSSLDFTGFQALGVGFRGLEGFGVRVCVWVAI